MAKETAEKQNPLRRAASSVRRAFGKLTHHNDDHEVPVRQESETAAPAARSATAEPGQARTRRVESDFPLDGLDDAYMPTQTSLKSSFRADGADRQRDQEFAGGADDRWNDEDRLTNKSGDPRIGTHGRTYEPGERRH